MDENQVKGIDEQVAGSAACVETTEQEFEQIVERMRPRLLKMGREFFIQTRRLRK